MSVIALEDLQELISRAVFLRNATADDRAQEMTEGTGSLVRVMTRCLQGAVNVPEDVIDRHLDAVLRAGGSALRHYTMQSSIDAMRAAMRAATTPVPLYDSQCRELCVALGWLGGTYHQVLAEVKRLKAADLARGDAGLEVLQETYEVRRIAYLAGEVWLTAHGLEVPQELEAGDLVRLVSVGQSEGGAV